MKRIKYLLLVGTLLASFAGTLAPAVAVHAAPKDKKDDPAPTGFKADACSGVAQVGGGKCGEGGGAIEKAMRAAINIFSIIVGFAAVIVVIISGLRFITSGGDAANVAKARTGLIYAIVGLVLVVMAQTIVHFVLGKVK